MRNIFAMVKILNCKQRLYFIHSVTYHMWILSYNKVQFCGIVVVNRIFIMAPTRVKELSTLGSGVRLGYNFQTKTV